MGVFSGFESSCVGYCSQFRRKTIVGDGLVSPLPIRISARWTVDAESLCLRRSPGPHYSTATEHASLQPGWWNDKVTAFKVAIKGSVEIERRRFAQIALECIGAFYRRCSMSKEAHFVVDTKPNRKPLEFFKRRHYAVSMPLSMQYLYTRAAVFNHRCNGRILTSGRPKRITLQ